MRARPLDKPLRIGVFGGTFDPIHNVHIDIARAALNFAHLDRILFIVSARPPHKRGEYVAKPEERYAMVEAALANEPHMEASRIELDRQGPSYTTDTLQTLQEAYPGAELVLIVGMDSLADLPQWKNAQLILDQAAILAVPRPGEFVVPAILQGRYKVLPFPKTDESSTYVRRHLSEGDNLDGRVPAAAAAYIHEHHIYDVDSQSTQGR